MKNKHFWISGVVPAVYTPMHTDGSINFNMIPTIVERMIRDGASALYVCGSTGEGPSLSTEERMEVTAAYLQATNGRIPIIVQVGHNCLRQAFRLAQHAQENGADAISSIPPTYFKIDDLEILMDCLVEITSGAPNLPFYYYHIPRLTAVQMDMVEFLQRGKERLPTLQGIKYSTFTVWEFQACVQFEGGRFNMLFGSDEMLLSGLVGGAHGTVGSTYNFALPLYNKIIAAFEQGEIEEAQHLQGLSVKMVQVLNRYGTASSNAAPLKAMMKIIGIDCGPMRLPQDSLTPEETKALEKEMKAIGFFDWARN